MTLTHRPCGVCRELVPVTGCRHWRPSDPVDAKTLSKRLRNAETKRRARERARQQAKEAVAEFHRQMGVGG